jgi:thioredoxin reductase (NADPH)
MCESSDVAVVGGGNSAGQAAVFLSKWAKHVHILTRSSNLASAMSRYLIRRIEETPAITMHPNTELVGLDGNNHLESITWRNNKTGETEAHPFRHVYLMTGASPNTDWLRGAWRLTTKDSF